MDFSDAKLYIIRRIGIIPAFINRLEVDKYTLNIPH